MGRNLVRLLAGALATVAILVAATTSHAYVTVKAGYFMPNDDSDGLKNWDDGFGGELNVGGEFGDAFAIEGGAGYWMTEPDGGADLTLGVVPVTLTGKFLLGAGAGLTLYVGGGAGFYAGFLTGDATEGMDSDDKRGTGFGVHAVAGLEIPTPALSFVGEIRWSQADVEFGDSDDSSNVGGLTALVGLKF